MDPATCRHDGDFSGVYQFHPDVHLAGFICDRCGAFWSLARAKCALRLITPSSEKWSPPKRKERMVP